MTARNGREDKNASRGPRKVAKVMFHDLFRPVSILKNEQTSAMGEQGGNP